MEGAADTHRETIARGDVDIWIADPATLTDAALRVAYEALLTDEERARQRAFVFEKNRREDLLTRALVRSTLSRYRPCDPAAWRFVRNAHGRPSIDPPCGLSFNLSNHTSLVVCAVAEGLEIGIDVEPLSRAPAIADLAQSVFTAEERAELERLTGRARLDRAVTLWTLKESYVKARGMGLAVPLAAFAFSFGDTAAPRIAFRPSIDDRPERWWFRTLALGDHRIALTAERVGSDPPVVRVRHCVPLRSHATSRR